MNFQEQVSFEVFIRVGNGPTIRSAVTVPPGSMTETEILSEIKNRMEMDWKNRKAIADSYPYKPSEIEVEDIKPFLPVGD